MDTSSPYDSGMPTNYDTGPTSAGSSSKTDMDFVRSLKGIFRAVEIILSLIAFICAAVGQSGPGANSAAGWCMFVSMFNFLVLLITYFLWLFWVFSKLNRAPIKFIEFVYFTVWTIFWLIAGIVAAAFGNRHPGMGAAAFFNFAAMILHAVDTYFHFQYWRSSDEGPYICGKTSGGASSGPPATGPPTVTAGSDTRGPQY